MPQTFNDWGMCCLQVGDGQIEEDRSLQKELFGGSSSDDDDDVVDSIIGPYEKVGNSRSLLTLACCYNLERSAAVPERGKAGASIPAAQMGSASGIYVSHHGGNGLLLGKLVAR